MLCPHCRKTSLPALSKWAPAASSNSVQRWGRGGHESHSGTLRLCLLDFLPTNQASPAGNARRFRTKWSFRSFYFCSIDKCHQGHTFSSIMSCHPWPMRIACCLHSPDSLCLSFGRTRWWLVILLTGLTTVSNVQCTSSPAQPNCTFNIHLPHWMKYGRKRTVNL